MCEIHIIFRCEIHVISRSVRFVSYMTWRVRFVLYLNAWDSYLIQTCEIHIIFRCENHIISTSVRSVSHMTWVHVYVRLHLVMKWYIRLQLNRVRVNPRMSTVHTEMCEIYIIYDTRSCTCTYTSSNKMIYTSGTILELI